jgi:peptidoglycan/LPS O-acetylase OafA/YrhL
MIFKPNSIQESQLDVLVLLRGVAVLLVCFCHFGAPLSEGHAFASLFQWFDDYGKYGVHVFFCDFGVCNTS